MAVSSGGVSRAKFVAGSKVNTRFIIVGCWTSLYFLPIKKGIYWKTIVNLRKWSKTNQGIAFILSVVCVILLVQGLLSPWVYRKLGDGFYLGFFPMLSIVLILLFSLILIFDSHRKEIPPDLMTLTFKSFLWALLILGGCWLYFQAMSKLGFLIATPIFLTATMCVLGFRCWWKGIVVAVVTTAIVYTMFSLLGLKWPSGSLLDILPF